MQEGDKTARVLMQSCSDSTSAASSILVECKVPIRAFAVTLIWPDNYCVISQVCEARENQTRGAGGGAKKSVHENAGTIEAQKQEAAVS